MNAAKELEIAQQSMAAYQQRVSELETSHYNLSQQVTSLSSENDTLKHQNSMLALSRESEEQTEDLQRQLQENLSNLNLLRVELTTTKEKCQLSEDKFEKLHDEYSKYMGKYHSMNVKNLEFYFVFISVRLNIQICKMKLSDGNLYLKIYRKNSAICKLIFHKRNRLRSRPLFRPPLN